VKKVLVLPSILLLFAGFGYAEARPPNWTGKYAPCNNHGDLLRRGHVDLAVRFVTTNKELAQQFASAMDFWAGVLDVDWHRVDSDDCAIQVVDGNPALFNFCRCMSARSQLPDRPAFQGWIAFNPRLKLTRREMFLDSVHEIGHLLGLPHNPSDTSVMFDFGTNKSTLLDGTDLRILFRRHDLRPQTAADAATMRAVRVSIPRSGNQGWLQSVASWFQGFRLHSESSADAISSGRHLFSRP
jgi:hypothetical protein